MLQAGDRVPDFETRDQHGNTVKLQDLRGQKIAIYFYPKDDTPGCTKQACNLRDNYKELQDAGIKILGASLDDEASHQKFISKFDLPFPLLSDTDKSLAESFGVYGERSFMGKKYMGVARTTFLIDEQGSIKKVISKPDVEAHTDEILEAFAT